MSRKELCSQDDVERVLSYLSFISLGGPLGLNTFLRETQLKQHTIITHRVKAKHKITHEDRYIVILKDKSVSDPEGGVYSTIKALTNTHIAWSLSLCTLTPCGHVLL